MPDLHFSDICDDDVAAVVNLWKICGLIQPQNDPIRDIETARAGPSSTILVGKTNNILVASVMVGHDGHRGMVYYVCVDPEHQGNGYGKQVMRAAEDWLKSIGVWKLNLLVRSENAKVRGFYENLGYEVEPRLCMARKLITP